jgi:hypothetical protein
VYCRVIGPWQNLSVKNGVHLCNVNMPADIFAGVLTEVSLPCLQEPATVPCPVHVQASLHPHTVSLRSILILSSHPCLGLLSDLI